MGSVSDSQPEFSRSCSWSCSLRRSQVNLEARSTQTQTQNRSSFQARPRPPTPTRVEFSPTLQQHRQQSPKLLVASTADSSASVAIFRVSPGSGTRGRIQKPPSPGLPPILLISQTPTNDRPSPSLSQDPDQTWPEQKGRRCSSQLSCNSEA